MIVFHERYLDHRQGFPEHPENPRRLEAILDRLKAEGLWNEVLTPAPARLEDCLRVHAGSYLKALENFGEGAWDPDTQVHPETFSIALLAAGGGILAAETAHAEGRLALALARPPGHHATADNAMGFCYLNNIAIAAARLIAEGKGPVAIVDIDVHHGNGTQETFFASDEVLFISLHQFPLFPGTGWLDEIGTGRGRGFTVNLPLPPRSGGATYGAAFDRLVEPILSQFRPAIILVSLGTDAHYTDPLAEMALSSPSLVQLVDRLWRLAKNLCGGRIACFLEGGYFLEALA